MKPPSLGWKVEPYYCYCWGGDETKMYHMGLALLIVSGFPRVGNRDLDAQFDLTSCLTSFPLAPARSRGIHVLTLVCLSVC